MNKFITIFTVLMAIQVYAHHDHDHDCNINNTPMIQAGHKQYYFETYFKTSWYGALQNCRYHGMHLVSIETDEEVVALNNIVHKLGYNERADSFWTSGNDFVVNRTFVWMGTGHKLDLNKTSWFPGEPNNVKGIEDCVALWNKENKEYKLNDISCDYQFYFICEKICDAN